VRMFPAGALRRRLRCVSIDIDTHAGHFRTRERGGENDPQFLPRETPLLFSPSLSFTATSLFLSLATPSAGALAILLAKFL
jgi:hypothetical protein